MLRQWVERLVTLLPIRHVADLVGLHWHTVKTIDKQRLQRGLPAPDSTRLRRLAGVVGMVALTHWCASPGSWNPIWMGSSPAPSTG